MSNPDDLYAFEVVDTTAYEVAMKGFLAGNFQEPAYSRNEVYWLMVHQKPETRADSFDVATEIYLEQVHALADLALAASSSELDKTNTRMQSEVLAKRVTEQVCVQEATAGYQLIVGWLDKISGIRSHTNHEAHGVIGLGVSAMVKSNFNDYLGFSEKPPKSTLEYWRAMQSATNFTLLSVFQRYEKWVENHSEL